MKKILIVEDEQDMLEALVDKLSREGFETLQAKDGVEGLEVALREHPDLILLDIVMPKMDGMAMMERIRHDSWGKNVPIIILTNYSASEQEKIERIIEDKPDYYLIKSDWKIADVVKKVKETLESQKSSKN